MEKRNYSKMTSEELSQAINLVKSENPGVFRVEDLRKSLKTLGVPMSNEFATTLVQQGIVVKAGLTYQDGYSWADNNPIHMNKAVELLTITRKKVSAQARRYNEKKKAIQNGTYKEESKNPTPIEEEIIVEPVQEHKELVPVDKAINKAIKLLLEHGYRVTKPVIIYEEVTVKNL